jgi:hypothetical protein
VSAIATAAAISAATAFAAVARAAADNFGRRRQTRCETIITFSAAWPDLHALSKRKKDEARYQTSNRVQNVHGPDLETAGRHLIKRSV